MINSESKILLISPHTDDIEFWASGLVFKHPDATYHHICFSLCPLAIPEGFDADDAHDEWIKAQKFMGMDNYKLFGFPERRFQSSRQDILDILYQKSQSFEPDIVLAPSLNDVHQDHATVGHEVLRAFSDSTILQYTGARSIIQNNYNYLCVITKRIMGKKAGLMKIFKSQLKIKPYHKYVIKTMRYFGSMFGKDYIEPYVCYRVIER